MAASSTPEDTNSGLKIGVLPVNEVYGKGKGKGKGKPFVELIVTNCRIVDVLFVTGRWIQKLDKKGELEKLAKKVITGLKKHHQEWSYTYNNSSPSLPGFLILIKKETCVIKKTENVNIGNPLALANGLLVEMKQIDHDGVLGSATTGESLHTLNLLLVSDMPVAMGKSDIFTSCHEQILKYEQIRKNLFVIGPFNDFGFNVDTLIKAHGLTSLLSSHVPTFLSYKSDDLEKWLGGDRRFAPLTTNPSDGRFATSPCRIFTGKTAFHFSTTTSFVANPVASAIMESFVADIMDSYESCESCELHESCSDTEQNELYKNTISSIFDQRYCCGHFMFGINVKF